MLTLYATDRGVIPEIRSAIPLDQHIEVTKSLKEIGEQGSPASCSIVAISSLGTHPATAHLTAFKASHPDHPVILVTKWDPDNARHLKNLQVEEVVWTGEIRQYLGPIVKRTCSCDFNHVRCLAVPIEKAREFPPALRRALAQACREERPVVSVNQLAQMVGVNRRTLWHQWNSVVGVSSLRLQDFVHWILLIRAIGRKTPEKPWSEIAEEMGMAVETLSRHAKQLTGETLQQLVAMGALNLAQRFRRTVYEVLLREGGLAQAEA